MGATALTHPEHLGASALARREREQLLTADQVNAVLEAVRHLAETWVEIVPTDAVHRAAERLVRMHPPGAADSLQLAAALIACAHDPASLGMVCLDEWLAAAARREGFTVIGALTVAAILEKASRPLCHRRGKRGEEVAR